ncbi:MAG TPA: putative peptidoglycan-binding domain-containing protein, partial [Candidatus Binatia bacterium]|nr:putative peptidoglycan-binding domain-containing protein [Candidatus Binatia bacterium]
LQTALNSLNKYGALWPDVDVDGRMGPATLSALRLAISRGDSGMILKAVNVLQAYYYLTRRKEEFVRGWLAQRVMF